MCGFTKQVYITNRFPLIEFMVHLSEKLFLCWFRAFRAHQRESWRTEEGELGWNTLMLTVVHSVHKRWRWILTNAASQGQHYTSDVTPDKSSGECSTLMEHDFSVVDIHHTFIMPRCFHCLCCPSPLFWETSFPPAFCLTPLVPKARREKWVTDRWSVQ